MTDIEVSYFVLCDLVITEEGTRKQSLVGIYSALVAQQFPFYVNMAAAICLRVRSASPHRLTLRIVDSDDKPLFVSTELPCNWAAVGQGLANSPFAVLQFGFNLNMMPFQKPGLYKAEMLCDEETIATYPLTVFIAQQQQPPLKM